MSETLPPRPTFTEGQYIGASDLNAAVDYARDETRRLALSSRNWGVVSGLALVERATATGEVQLFIEPGLAWDGYGRPVLVGAPAPVTLDLFAGLPSGNQIVWLRYNAVATQSVQPGFETCGAGDPTTRVTETYAIEAGPRTPNKRTDGVVIAGATVVDPRDLLIVVDADAPVELDGSAPHQAFPDDTGRWLIPVGIAAYVAGAPGAFNARTAAQLMESRRVRRYAGVAAETLLAADGVLRLRDRLTDQASGLTDDDLDQAAQIKAADLGADAAGRLVGNELVWVEGNLRATGNVRLFGTRLELRDASGIEAGGAPQFLRRGLSAGNLLGGQDLQVAIGASGGTPGADRLAVGVVEPPTAAFPDGRLDEKLVVRSDARMAVGTNAIDSYSADANQLVIAAVASSGLTVVSSAASKGALFFAHGAGAKEQKAGYVTYDHSAAQLLLGAGAATLMTLAASGQVVIGEADPASFDSDADQLVVANKDGPAGLTIAGAEGTAGRIDFANWTTATHAGYIRYSLALDKMEFGAASGTRVFFNGDGRVGIGVANPTGRLQLASPADSRSLRLDVNSLQALDGGAPGVLWLQPDGADIAVGVTTPQSRMHVRAVAGGSGLTVDSPVATAIHTVDARVSLGTSAAPRTTLDVKALNPDLLTDPGGHVAVVQNTWTGPCNVLALQVGSSGPVSNCNYITFLDAAGAELGAVEGYSTLFGESTVRYASYAADYAEAAPRAPGVGPIGPGRIVGVRGGQVSLDTGSAEALFVTTDRPAVVGAMPARDRRDDYEILAFLGQAPVTVQGPVAAGDLILASGGGDGLGRAVAPDKLEPADLPQVVGRAWQASTGSGVARVNALVGPGVAATAATAGLLQRQADEIARLAALVAALQAPPAKTARSKKSAAGDAERKAP